MICLETKNEEWVVQLSRLVNRFRGVSPFCYGETFVSAEPLCDDSKMDGFVVFAPPFLSADEFSTALPDGGRLHVSALYPIYREEAEFIKQVGLERFWKSDDLQDIYSVNRPSIVK